jgi:glycosyltransferase involved in cell wall biosynthesis
VPAATDPPPRADGPRVGVLSAWFDPEDPTVWSGVPAGVVGELRRLGVFAGTRNVTPWVPAARLVHRWMRLTGRTEGWILRPEMRVLGQLSDAARRVTTPRDVDGWVHFLGAFGPAVRSRYVTLFDMSPTQLRDAGPSWARSFGYPHAGARQMDWVYGRHSDAYAGAHACCVPSRWAADSVVRDHGISAARVHIVGYGRNADIPAPPGRDWSRPRFLFVGRDWKRKNGAAVLRAFERVRREVPAAHLDLVGDHPLVELEGVTGHGPLGVHEPEGKARVEQLFASATCFVLPSMLEPFGIVYVEAAAAGIASIGTSRGGTADSIGDGGVRVDPEDDDALHDAMRSMCDPGVARELGRAAHQRASAFTWSAVGQRVVRALDLGAVPGHELAEFL